MKTAIKIVVVALTMAWAGTVFAQGAGNGLGRAWCGPAGTWIGSNETYDLEFVVTIDPMGRQCFSVVGEGLEVTPPWESATAWRGTARKTGPDTYAWTQVTFASPSQLTDPSEGVPDIAAIRGELRMLDCDHFEIEFGPTEVYAWGQTPFEDDPMATWPPSIARYTRVPVDCGSENQ